MLKSSSSIRTVSSLSACSIIAATLLLAAPVFAQEQSSSSLSSTNFVALPKVIDAVAKNTKKRFLLDPRVQGNVPKEGLDLDRLSYRELQALLRLHGFAVVEISNTYNVIPDANMRQLPLPVIDKDSNSIGDDDCVVKVISVGKLEAVRLVPLLRPMLPQYAHLAALADNNALVVVATYANVKTIEATVRALEKQPIVPQKVAQAN